MRRVVMFSGGVSSWAAARVIADREGTEGMTLLFADTMTEDEDLYRFIGEAAADIGVPLTRIADGRTIWDVFRDERFLGNSRADPCSKLLKRSLCRAWMDANEPDAAIVFGYDVTEVHRHDRSAALYAPRLVESPLIAPPYPTRSDMFRWLEERGIAAPRLYGMGLTHNNCGGGCVKAGQGHFAKLLDVFPERYTEWERNEQAIRDHLGADVSILTDRRDGGRRPLTLRELRERIESRQRVDMLDIGGCGCFADPDGA